MEELNHYTNKVIITLLAHMNDLVLEQDQTAGDSRDMKINPS